MVQKVFIAIFHSFVKILVFILILFTISKTVFADNGIDENLLNESNASNKVIFHNLPSDFNYRATRSIIRDHRDLMWFGTENGLVRFDGINQKAYEYDPKDPSSIHHNTVNVLYEDKNNKLWIGTTQGLCYYNRIQDNFGQIDIISDETALLNQAYISSIVAMSDSLLWIGTFAQGLFSLNIYSKQIVRHTHFFEAVSNTNITCLQADSTNHLWIGTQSGLILYNTETGQFEWFYNDRYNHQSISNNNITSIQKDNFGNIWVGTQDGGLNLVATEGSTFIFERMNSISARVRVSSNAINRLLADDKGYLWIGTENDGLHLLNIQSGTVEVYTHEAGNDKTIGSNSIWSIYHDREGRVWLGTYNKGISVYDPYYSKFKGFQTNPYSVNGLVNNDVRGFCETADGKIWIATDGGGICRLDLQTHTYDKTINTESKNNALTSNSLQTIICSCDGKIWIGSWGGGIDRLTQEGKFKKNYKVERGNGVGNNKIRTIHQDKRGNIWAGTNGSGLFLYNKAIDEFEPFVYQDLVKERSYIIYVNSDIDNKLWIGTLEGLISLELDDKGKVVKAKSYTAENSGISINAMSNLLIDKLGKLWIGTTNGGLNIFNPDDESFKILRKSDGLPSNNISGILEDMLGNIWISTNNGIAKIDISTFKVSNFSIADGLNSNVFYSKSSYKTKNGLLLFGSNKGFNLIEPEKVKTNRNIPNILLTELRINNSLADISGEGSPLIKQLSETDTLILNYKQNSFSIDFVALNYTRPEQNQYSYKLEGYDDEWNHIGTKRTAHYTKVTPGTFIFKVIGSNNDGIWNEVPTHLVIIVNPPFWETKWAYISYMLFFFVIVFFIFREWQERVHIRYQLRLEKMAKIKEHELNRKNLEFFTNISHEFRTPLSLIIGPIESLIKSVPEKMLDQLKVIQRNSQRLLSLTNNLLDLRKLEEGGMQLNISKVDIVKSTDAIVEFFNVHINKQKINLTIDYPKTETVFYFDNEKYTTVLFNLLSNAIKYTHEDGSIGISIKHQPIEKQLEVSVVNTGIGILSSELPNIFDKFYQADSGRDKRQFGTGIGLALCKGLVELQGGKIWASSIPEQETTFTFTIKLNHEDTVLEKELNDRFLIPTSEVYADSYESEDTTQEPYKNEENRPLVLVVEDNSDLRFFLKNELERLYAIVLAANGEEGLRKAKEIIPDLIISDVVMPIMNGIELCKAIKEDVSTSHIPFIMLTAKTTTNEQIEGLDTGADAYITKPFEIRLLQTQVANLILSRKELYARFSQDVYIMAHKQSDNDLDKAFLQKTIEYILNNITDSKLNIESLAAYHNMSHRNLYRKIKALTGNTVVEFIRIVRLKHAVKLMESQQHTLSEVAYMTGFTSPSYFTKTFRQFYGKPPSEYLNKNT